MSAAARRWRPQRGPLLLVGLGLALLVAVAIPIVSMGRMLGGAPPLSRDELAAATPGTHLEVALEVGGPPSDGLITGRVLERLGAGRYRRTDLQLQASLAPDTPVVMGQREDVQAGAVVQVRGHLSTARAVLADRVVILTGAVQVE